MMIDWQSSNSHLLLNPAFTDSQKNSYEKIIANSSDFPAHIWVSTSGSSSQKWVGLSKEAFLNSATAVNQHIDSQATDHWIHCLPGFHVGGIGICARAFLSGAKVHDYKLDYPGKWNAHHFAAYVASKKGTLAALVPTQVYDLVLNKIEAPPTLRCVIVGGGCLSSDVYAKARALNWPLLPSFGMTECATQVATASLDSLSANQFPSLVILSHLTVKAENDCLWIKGSSLLSAYASFHGPSIQFQEVLQDGWFKTSDRGEVQGQALTIFGREDAVIKIGGERVDLAYLENVLQSLCLKLYLNIEATLVTLQDDRLENIIALAIVDSNHEKYTPLIEAFQSQVLPFEKIRQVISLPYLPKSPLGKILKQELYKLVYFKKFN